MSSWIGAATAASATFHDLRRRPGILLAALAVAALLALLPDICARAVDDSNALGLQAGTSTLALFLTLLAGFAGLRAGAPDGESGASAEWRTSPLGPGQYVAGRFAGILAAAGLLLAALLPFLLMSQIEAFRDEPPEVRVGLFALAGLLFTAAQFAAIGLLLGTLTSPQLAAILLVATIVATRTLVPDLATRGPVLRLVAAALPDPARLDLSRELAFHRTVDSGATLLAYAATAFHCAACLCGASWALSRREI